MLVVPPGQVMMPQQPAPMMPYPSPQLSQYHHEKGIVGGSRIRGGHSHLESTNDDLMRQGSNNSVIDYDRYDSGGYAIQRDKAMAARYASNLKSAKNLQGRKVSFQGEDA